MTFTQQHTQRDLNQELQKALTLPTLKAMCANAASLLESDSSPKNIDLAFELKSLDSEITSLIAFNREGFANRPASLRAIPTPVIGLDIATQAIDRLALLLTEGKLPASNTREFHASALNAIMAGDAADALEQIQASKDALANIRATEQTRHALHR